MKRTFFLIVIALLFIEGIGNELLAQPKKGLIGIAINLTKGFLVSQDISTPQAPFTLGFIYLPSDKLHLEGDIGLRVQKDTSGSTSSEFVFGSNIWYVIQNYEELSTFAGGGIHIGSSNRPKAAGSSLLALNVFYGTEYWFDKHFACNGRLGIVYARYSISSKPATDFYTSAQIGLTWYF